MPKIYDRTCDYCDKPYRGRGQFYCSDECRRAVQAIQTTLNGKDSINPAANLTELRMAQEIRELRQKVRQSQDRGVMFEVLADVIRENAAPLDAPPAPKRKPTSDVVEEEVVAMFSDAHADQVIKPERVLGFEDFGWGVFCIRLERWVDRIVRWTQHHLPKHQFKRLWIPCLGDNTEGDIHGATKHTTWQNTMKGALAVGDALAFAVTDLARVFDEITIIGLPGNHPRWAKTLNWRGAHENFDYLTMVQLATRLDPLITEGRVTVDAPDAYSAVAEICGWNFLMSHGHEVKSWNGIPYYGLERRERRIHSLFSQRDHKLHYHLIGHFHQSATLSTTAGEIFMNGAWMWTSEYAFDALGAASKPMQWLLGVHRDIGVSWRLPIHIADREREASGEPGRYDQRIMYDLGGLDRAARSGIPILK